MNYKHIHDAIIQRARLRKYVRNEHHLHHVKPKHEDPTSTDVVPLTVKEHRLVHRLRFKFIGTLGNYLAWKLLSSQLSDKNRLICSTAGMIGGHVTRTNNLGIFSPTYNRSTQSKTNYVNGIGLAKLTLEERSIYGSIGGTITRESNSGIFREDLQFLRSTWAAIGRQSQPNTQGFCSPEWKEANQDQIPINASKGGKIGGKKVGNMLWWNNGVTNKKSVECPGQDWVRGMLMSEKKRQQVMQIAGHNRKKEV